MEIVTSMMWLLVLVHLPGTIASDDQTYDRTKCTILHMIKGDGWAFSLPSASHIQGWIRHESEDPRFAIQFGASAPLEVPLSNPGTWHEIIVLRSPGLGHHEVRMPSLNITLRSSAISSVVVVKVTSSKLVIWSDCQPDFFHGTDAFCSTAARDQGNNNFPFLLVLVLPIIAILVALALSVYAFIIRRRYKKLVKEREAAGEGSGAAGQGSGAAGQGSGAVTWARDGPGLQDDQIYHEMGPPQLQQQPGYQRDSVNSLYMPFTPMNGY